MPGSHVSESMTAMDGNSNDQTQIPGLDEVPEFWQEFVIALLSGDNVIDIYTGYDKYEKATNIVDVSTVKINPNFNNFHS